MLGYRFNKYAVKLCIISAPDISKKLVAHKKSIVLIGTRLLHSLYISFGKGFTRFIYVCCSKFFIEIRYTLFIVIGQKANLITHRHKLFYQNRSTKISRSIMLHKCIVYIENNTPISIIIILFKIYRICRIIILCRIKYFKHTIPLTYN